MKFSNLTNILQENFVFSEKPARLLSLALETKKNCLLYGDAGHGKSEMVEAAIKGLELTNETYVQGFGEGMDEARLWGGLDFRALEDEKILHFAPHRSFLNYRIAVFEELFDAPAIVLQSLKDTLTARELRNGEQRFKMKTLTIIAVTNRHPSEISELGAAAHALVERFPLQHEVKWDAYTAGEFEQLFAKVKPEIPKVVRQNLAGLIGKTHEAGHFISPRTAIHALESVMAEGDARYADLEFIPGFAEIHEGMQAEIKAMEARRFAKKKIEEIEFNLALLVDDTKVDAETSPIKLLQLTKKLNALDGQLEALAVQDALSKKRDSLRKNLQAAAKSAQQKALEVTYE